MAEKPWVVGHLDLGPSTSARTVLDALHADGTSRGNISLRRDLDLDKPTYAAAVDELVRAGALQRGPGRGGTVARVIDGVRAAETPVSVSPDGAAPRRGPERARRDGTSSAVAESEPQTERDGYLLQGPGGLFETIRSHVSTAQGQGQVFERLIKAFLSEDPLFHERFRRVFLWQEWPGRKGERDTGIDLVAEEGDGGICAIQCKFYGNGQYIGREDIDSFLVASARRPFTARLFVSTTERWSTNAEKVLADQHVPVQRLGVGELEQSPFDWSRYDPDHPDQLPRHRAKQVRPHQRRAIDDVVSGLEEAERGKLVMACGTGKTFTALRIAEELVPAGGTVLFCVPSISLLSQSLRAWSADATRPLHCLAVCSDVQVTRDSEDIHVYDLALPATTEPERIAEHLGIAAEQTRGEENPLVVVFSTYQSLDKVAAAQQKGAPVFDLVIADEAHRTTGAFPADESYSGFTLVHDGERLRARRCSVEGAYWCRRRPARRCTSGSHTRLCPRLSGGGAPSAREQSRQAVVGQSSHRAHELPCVVSSPSSSR